jgi:uncharacterized membrane protein YhaH (DUF805 family)
MNWYVEALRKYSEFGGRARRKEFWMFFLINFLITCVLDVFSFAAIRNNVPGMNLGVLSVKLIYELAVLIPGIAVTVRRFHDTDRSGWWILLPIINLIFLCPGSQTGPNRFGPNAKEPQERV